MNLIKSIVCVLFFLTIEGSANRWWHTLLPTSVDSLLTLLKELYQAFDKYNHQDVHERISRLRMKPSELVDYFVTRFLHLCHKILE